MGVVAAFDGDLVASIAVFHAQGACCAIGELGNAVEGGVLCACVPCYLGELDQTVVGEGVVDFAFARAEDDVDVADRISGIARISGCVVAQIPNACGLVGEVGAAVACIHGACDGACVIDGGGAVVVGEDRAVCGVVVTAVRGIDGQI